MRRLVLSHGLVGGSLLLAALVNLVLWPEIDATLLYALPIVIAAGRYPPRLIVMTAAITVVLATADLRHDGVALQVWPLALVTLALIAWLSVRVAVLLQENARRAQEAEAARRRLQEFMGMVAHDLRNPLTIALGYTQLLRNPPRPLDAAQMSRTVDSVESAIQKMNRLVTDLLDATRIGGGRFVIQRQPIDLSRLADEVVAEHRAINPDYRFLLEAPSELRGDWDALRLNQVLTNLVSNAIKYSDPGTEVRITLRPEPNTVTLAVADQGPGLTREQIGQLFQPFARLEHTRQATGTGLGLYITKGIVDAHGGRIWIESTVGSGSIFWVTLPR